MITPPMTPTDARFLEEIRETFGERPFSSDGLVRRVHRDFYPDPIVLGLPRKDPVRMFGGWLPRRVGWTHRGLTLQKLGRIHNAQQWKFGVLPDADLGDRAMITDGDRWWWASVGLWPDEVVK